MVKFDGKIVEFGFGAVGKSFFEKLSKEIEYDENKFYVISRDKGEFGQYINLGGMASNFITKEITKDNYKEVFGSLLEEGDLLIDFADTVGTKDILEWCMQNNIMYINTGETDWPDNWYSILDENLKKREVIKKYNGNKDFNKYPIVLHHGNNPGLVSHFVKLGLEEIVKKQFRKDKELKELLKQNKFNEIAYKIGLRMIHVNDNDFQEVKNENNNILFNPWCVDSFFFEMLSESTLNVGTHEKIDYEDICKQIDLDNGFIEFKNIAVDKRCNTYYPKGKFTGHLVPHEETISIAQNLEVKENGKVIYRPSVMFLYSPCDSAIKFLNNSRVNSYPDVDINKPQDVESTEPGKDSIVRGYIYPDNAEILYMENIVSGTEYVGVLLIGDKFNPVWVGNRIEKSFLYKDKKSSYWQTPTITPVAMSALSAVVWMIKNKDKGGVYFPDEIDDYKFIVKNAEKYISKTIYKTFNKKKIEEELGIDFENIQAKDFFKN